MHFICFFFFFFLFLDVLNILTRPNLYSLKLLNLFPKKVKSFQSNIKCLKILFVLQNLMMAYNTNMFKNIIKTRENNFFFSFFQFKKMFNNLYIKLFLTIDANFPASFHKIFYSYKFNYQSILHLTLYSWI